MQDRLYAAEGFSDPFDLALPPLVELVALLVLLDGRLDDFQIRSHLLGHLVEIGALRVRQEVLGLIVFFLDEVAPDVGDCAEQGLRREGRYLAIYRDHSVSEVGRVVHERLPLVVLERQKSFYQRIGFQILVHSEDVLQEGLQADAPVLDEFDSEVSAHAPLAGQSGPLDALVVLIRPEHVQQVIEITVTALDDVDLLVAEFDLFAFGLHDIVRVPAEDQAAFGVLRLDDPDTEVLLP